MNRTVRRTVRRTEAVAGPKKRQLQEKLQLFVGQIGQTQDRIKTIIINIYITSVLLSYCPTLFQIFNICSFPAWWDDTEQDSRTVGHLKE